MILFLLKQGMSGLRGVDKRHLALYLPVIMINLLMRDPLCRVFDHAIYLSVQLLRVIDIIRAPRFSEHMIRSLQTSQFLKTRDSRDLICEISRYSRDCVGLLIAEITRFAFRDLFNGKFLW